jgi:hypothetical protein
MARANFEQESYHVLGHTTMSDSVRTSLPITGFRASVGIVGNEKRSSLGEYAVRGITRLS